MAKKTAKKKTATKPTKKAAGAAPIAKPSAKKAPVKAKSAPPKLAVSNDQIGYAAGAVWSELHGKGWLTVAAIKKAVDFPPDTTTMAIGWLAREGKLDFLVSGRSVKVTLR